MYAEYSYNDFKVTIRLKSEEKLTDVMQQYESFCIVVSAALGGSKEEEVLPAPQTAQELDSALKKVFG